MKISIVLACIAAAAPSLVAGHGYMMVPKAQLASGDPTRYVTEVRGSTILPIPEGGSFSSTPQINVESFTKAFKASSFKSLKEFIEQKSPSTPSCGLTPAGGDPQDVPNEVQWSSFAESHVGPCEVWCDNTRVFQEDNCAGKYTQQPAKLPINKAGCANAKQLKFVWLALHSQDWQIYINCAPLKGSGQSGGSSGGNSGGNNGGNSGGSNNSATGGNNNNGGNNNKNGGGNANNGGNTNNSGGNNNSDGYNDEGGNNSGASNNNGGINQNDGGFNNNGSSNNNGANNNGGIKQNNGGINNNGSSNNNGGNNNGGNKKKKSKNRASSNGNNGSFRGRSYDFNDVDRA